MLVDHGNFMQRISWVGVLAGLVAGVVTQLALSALGVAVGAATVDTARGLALGTVLWLAISLAISAFVAGLTAARAAGYLTPAQGRFNGLLTGMLLVLAGTLFSYNALLGGVRTALGLAQGVTTAASSAANQADQQNAGGALAQNGAVQSVLNGLNENEISQIIAEQSPELDQEQTLAATRVVSGIVQRASNDVGNNLSNISRLDELIPARLDAIQRALTGEQFVTRLQRAGLSQPEAQETATAVSQRATELRQQAEQTVAATERIARRTASTAAWSWLLSAGLILLFSTLGGGRGHDVPQSGATMLPRDEEDPSLRGRRA